MLWLVKHAPWLYNRCLIYSDGQTSCERRWSRRYNRSICELAETLLYRPSRRELPKADVQWHYGSCLGRCTQSDEHYIGTPEGVMRTRDIKRLPKSEQYQVDNLRKVVGTP